MVVAILYKETGEGKDRGVVVHGVFVTEGLAKEYAESPWKLPNISFSWEGGSLVLKDDKLDLELNSGLKVKSYKVQEGL